RLKAEANYAKSLDGTSRESGLSRCSDTLQESFTKAIGRYGLNCTRQPVESFDAYLTQCSEDATAAATGSILPDYVGELAECHAKAPASLLTTGQTTSLDVTEICV